MADYFIYDPPYIDGSWRIFPNTVLSNLNLTDCDSSITGICEIVPTLKDCINLCQNSKEETCKAGYFIETPDKKNICVPIKQHGMNAKDIHIGPFYRIRQKDYYPIFKNLKSYIFASTDYPYPPNLANAIFYTDYFVLKNINTGHFFGMNEEGIVSDNKVMTDEQPVNVQFIPSLITRSYAENYIPVKNKEEITISIPHTSFVLRKSEQTDEVNWKMRVSTVATIHNNTFQVVCPKRPMDEVLAYTDEVYFLFQNFPLVYNEDTGTLSVSTKNIENCLADGDNVMFSFIPKIKGYYCSDTGCKSIQMEQAETNNYLATYENKPVYRSPSCWNTCKKGKEKSVNWKVLVPVVLLIVLVYIGVLYMT